MAITAVFLGTFVHTPTLHDLEIFHDHVLAINDTGYIEDFCPKAEASQYLNLPDISPTLIPSGSFLLPTFCDLHLHAAQYMYLGNGLHLPLMEWLNAYAFKAEEGLDADPTLARLVYKRLAQRLISLGTGATLLFGTIKEDTNIILAEAFQDAGIRGFVGKLSMDKSSRPSYIESSTKVSLDAANAFLDRCQGLVTHLPTYRQLVEPVLTPRFVPTCTDELLEGIGQLSASRGVKVQSHMAEARDQVDWVKSERGVNDIDVFNRSGLLTERTIQAHCTFLGPPDLALLHGRGTAIAHCPLSNVYFSSLPFPLREALDADVKVGLGSDVAGGYTLDIMIAMRQAVIMAKTRESARKEGLLATGKDGGNSLAVDWKESLYLATKGGAQALGLQGGSFVKGAPFDAQRIDLIDANGNGVGQLDFFDPLHSIKLDVVEKWWCLGQESNRSAVWIQGKKLM